MKISFDETVEERMNKINDKLCNLEEVIRDATTKIAEEHNLENFDEWEDWQIENS